MTEPVTATRPKEARLSDDGNGLAPSEPGWFIVNLAEARWRRNPDFGQRLFLEAEQRFPGLGVNVTVLEPGHPACYYHEESEDEAFLVLKGECLLLVDGQERPLRTHDFFYCAPGTPHVLVGAGSGPSVVIMVGRRSKEARIRYPVEPLALKRRAGVEKEVCDPKVAYAGITPSENCASPWREVMG